MNHRDQLNMDFFADISLKRQLEMTEKQELRTDIHVKCEMTDKADQFIAQLLTIDIKNRPLRDEVVNAIENLAKDIQINAAQKSAMLKDPIYVLAGKGEDGGDVANSLMELKAQVEELDPSNIDLSGGWFSRLLAMIPGMGTPMTRYFSRYQAAAVIIDAITRSLRVGAFQLKRDNVTLTDDQAFLQQMADKLQESVSFAGYIEQKLSDKMAKEISHEDPRYLFLSEEILFLLRQRIIDLQQQIAVAQQGVLTMEIIIRNNKELVRGVNRALNVTSNALQVAVTLAFALANQRIVLNNINAFNQTASELLSENSQRIKSQALDIQQQSPSSMLNMDSLKSAFQDINSAIDEIAIYRHAALPKMKSKIAELDQLRNHAEEKIKSLDSENIKLRRFTITLD